jgi:Lhr-like helicase
MPSVASVRQALSRDFFLYYDTAFRMSQSAVMAERARLLRNDGVLMTEPFIELMPEWAPAGRDNPRTIEQSVAYANAPTELASLVRGRLFPPEANSMWEHQEDALIASLKDEPVVVASGTSSGKTESFLLPALARLVDESRNWPAPLPDAEGGSWWRTSTRRAPQRTVRSNRPAAVRTLILYPMNALVEDQLTRLRQTLDSDSAREWFADHRLCNRFYFGRYTGLTPVSGAKDGSIKSRLLREQLQEADRRWEALLRQEDEERQHGKVPDPRRRLFLQRVEPGGSAEMRSRWDMQDAPPDILITNYSMLNITLMRSLEQTMWDQTRAWIEEGGRFNLVIDELHMYRGTSGTEVAYLIRRLLQRLGLATRRDQLSIMAASASLEDRPKDRQFLREFFAEPKSFAVIVGTRASRPAHSDLMAALPALSKATEWTADNATALLEDHSVAGTIERALHDDEQRHPAPTANQQVEWATALATPPEGCDGSEGRVGPRPMSVSRLARRLFPDADPDAAVQAFDVLTDAIGATTGQVRLRAHYFFRNLPSLWACSDPGCTAVDLDVADPGRTVGRLYTQPETVCKCGSRVLELLYCQACGEAFLGGFHHPDAGPARQFLLPYLANIDDLPDRGTDKSAANYTLYWPRSAQGYTPLRRDWTRGNSRYTFEFVMGHYDPRTGVLRRASNRAGSTGWYFVVRDLQGNEEAVPPLPIKCPHCNDDQEIKALNNLPVTDANRTRSPIRQLGTGFTKANQILSDAVLREMRSGGRQPKLVIFSDSRQDAARLGPDLGRAHFQDLVRALSVSALHAQSDVARIEELRAVGKADEALAALRELETTHPALHAALMRYFSGLASSTDTAMVDQARRRGVPLTITDLGRKLEVLLAELGVNPAGTKPSLQISRDGTPWPRLYDWGDRPLRPTAGLSATDRDFLDRVVRRSCRAEVERSVFSGVGRDFEAIGLALPSTTRTLPANPRCGYQPELFREVVHGALRLLGLRKKFDDCDARTTQEPPSNVKKYLEEVANRHGSTREDLIHDVGSALGVLSSGWLLDPSEIVLLQVPRLDTAGPPWADGTGSDESPQWHWRCSRCGRRHLHASAGTCTACLGSMRVAEPMTVDDTRYFESDYYATLARSSNGMFRLNAAELTGQTDRVDAASRQARFQDIFLREENPVADAVDLLSVTTTMEAGIDIGSLQTVALANMPPQRFNYQQRVGRAGRRGSALAVATTVCRGTRTHDQHYFDHPDRITGDPPPSPYVDTRSRDILQRAFDAEALWMAISRVGWPDDAFAEGNNTHGQFGEATAWATIEPAVAQWFAGNEPALRDAARSLLAETTQGGGVREDDLVRRCVSGELCDEVASIAREPAGHPALSQRLAERGLLPMYGFPTRVRYLYLRKPSEIPASAVIDRDIEIAISEFAPGSTVVKDGELHTAVGVVSYVPAFPRPAPVAEPLGRETRVGMCSVCMHVDVDPDQDRVTCPECLTPYRVTVLAEPEGFRTSYWAEDYEGLTDWAARAGSPRLSVPEPLTNSLMTRNLEVRGGKAELLTINDRGGRDFTFVATQWDGLLCEEALTDLAPRAQRLGKSLPSVDPAALAAARRVALGARSISDCLLLGVDSVPAGLSVNPTLTARRAAWLSFGYLVREAAWKILDVSPDELEVGILSGAGSDGSLEAEAFLADQLENGAGYSTFFASEPDRLSALVRGAAAEVLRFADHRNSSGDPCSSSCYECLRDYTNTRLHPLLDWRLACDLTELALTGEFDPADRDMYATEVARLFASGFPGWDLGSVGDVPALSSQDGSAAILVVHPFEDVHPTNWSKRLATAAVEQESTGYSFVDIRQALAVQRPCVPVTPFDLLRRPGWVQQLVRAH